MLRSDEGVLTLIGLFKMYGYMFKGSNSAIFTRCREWSGGAMVLGELPVLGRPTIWTTVGQGPTALAVGAGGGCLDILLSSILSFLFLPLFGRRPDID